MRVRRVITGHNERGEAVIIKDDSIAGTVGESGESLLAWSTGEFPSDNNDEFDGGLRSIRNVSPGGTALHVTTLSPGKSSSHHRTLSLDYGIVLDGEIELELDNGVTTRCLTGDVIIQRGTIHTWRNPTDRAATIAFVVVDATPVTVGGHQLDPTQPSGESPTPSGR